MTSNRFYVHEISYALTRWFDGGSKNIQTISPSITIKSKIYTHILTWLKRKEDQIIMIQLRINKWKSILFENKLSSFLFAEFISYNLKSLGRNQMKISEHFKVMNFLRFSIEVWRYFPKINSFWHPHHLIYSNSTKFTWTAGVPVKSDPIEAVKNAVVERFNYLHYKNKP